MKVRWTHEALVRLVEIEEFISRDSPSRERSFVDQIIERAESLSARPRIGRVVPEISNPNIRELIFKKHRIVYRVRKDVVEILTVFEGHRMLRIGEIEQ
jgi:plasmid stabilization system protein ParE